MTFTLHSDSPELLSQLALLTHNAEVTPSAVTFDEQTATVTIPMRRRHYARQRTLFGLGEKFRQIAPEKTESVLTIRDVIEFHKEERIPLPAIQLLFGVNVKEKEVYLCSAEERSGVHVFEVHVKVRSYSIELNDLE